MRFAFDDQANSSLDARADLLVNVLVLGHSRAGVEDDVDLHHLLAKRDCFSLEPRANGNPRIFFVRHVTSLVASRIFNPCARASARVGNTWYANLPIPLEPVFLQIDFPRSSTVCSYPMSASIFR